MFNHQSFRKLIFYPNECSENLPTEKYKKLEIDSIINPVRYIIRIVMNLTLNELLKKLSLCHCSDPIKNFAHNID